MNTSQAAKEPVANWAKKLSQSSKSVMRGKARQAEGKKGQRLETAWEMHT